MQDSPDATLAWLIQRVQILEAERAITRTLYSFAHSIDHGYEDAWVDCFTPDGRFSASSANAAERPAFDVCGADALLDFARHHTRPPELYHQHCLIQPLIDVDIQAGTAVSKSYMSTLMRWTDMEPIMRTFGRYRDSFQRCDDGHWRIQHRHVEIDAVRSGLPAIGYGRTPA